MAETSAAAWRPATGSIPTSPGVYRFMDGEGRVVYVGKARNLRSRLTSYFQDPALLHTRTATMVEAARSVDWTVVRTEVEALLLEYSWIKEFDPRFNVKYRDDKSYPYLAVTVAEEFPRAQVLRGERRKGVRYFGPYSHAWAIRDVLDQLLKVFPIRTCSAGVFRRAKASGRPCLLGYIDKCSAPCVDRVTPAEHGALVDDLCRFLSGDTSSFLKGRQRQMRAAAAVQDFERAARLRDQLRAMEHVLERNTVVLPVGTDADIIGIHEDELEAAVQVFIVRDGRIRGRRGWVTERVEDIDRAGLVEHFVQQWYSRREADEVPREILVPELPSGVEPLGQWLEQVSGRAVAIRVPQRGDKRALLDTVNSNAEEAFLQHRLRRSSDLTARSKALQEIQDFLGLPESPLRIECIDVSHLAGSDVVGSVVVFEDGVAKKSEYRRFAIRGQDGADDVLAVREIVRRRFLRYLEERAERDAEPVVDGRPRSFHYRPHLVVVDGAAAQAQAAQEELDELDIVGVAVVGLAKRLEEVWPAGAPDPVILPRGSEGLYLLQRIRDEAHRFAHAYQRAKRARGTRESVLDGIPGLGAAKRAALVKSFGSVKRIREATVDELCTVPGIGSALAQRIAAALHEDGAPQPASAVNTATGEIMEP